MGAALRSKVLDRRTQPRLASLRLPRGLQSGTRRSGCSAILSAFGRPFSRLCFASMTKHPFCKGRCGRGRCAALDARQQTEGNARRRQRRASVIQQSDLRIRAELWSVELTRVQRFVIIDGQRRPRCRFSCACRFGPICSRDDRARFLGVTSRYSVLNLG
jgi:hypothetical protein